jgi:hypothetical protein
VTFFRIETELMFTDTLCHESENFSCGRRAIISLDLRLGGGGLEPRDLLSSPLEPDLDKPRDSLGKYIRSNIANYTREGR